MTEVVNTQSDHARYDSSAYTAGARPFGIVRAVIVILLLVAATLKGAALVTEMTVSDRWFHARPFQIALIELELVFSIWLMFTSRQLLAWRLCVLFFTVFCGVAAWQLAAGAASCGCFGHVAVPPAVTVMLDVAVLTALFLTRPMAPSRSSPVPWQREARTVLLATVAIGIPVGIFLARPVGTSLGAGMRVVPGEIVLLEPETWLGQACPLLPYIETKEQLATGDWRVVLVHEGCARCEEAIPRYREMDSVDSQQLFLLEVPPSGETLAGIVHGHLDATIDWFVTTPTELVLKQGVVESVVVDRFASTAN
jgi:hypothetical protein